MPLTEQIFAALIVAWVTALTAVLWRLAGVPRRVQALEEMMMEYLQKAELLAGLQATVQAQGERIDRGQKRNIEEHDIMHSLLKELTGHVLELKPTDKKPRR
jgi:hypothetical protein